MPRSLAILGFLALLAWPGATAAQTEVSWEGLEYPARAQALLPAGLASHGGAWDLILLNGVPPGATSRMIGSLITSELDARIPIESLILQLRYAGAVRWFRLGPDQTVTIETGNPSLGAFFRDAPAHGWRYELGGSTTVPVATSTTADGRDPPIPVSLLFPPLPLPIPRRATDLGWDTHLYDESTWSLIPRARVEWDPIEELVLGLEVRVPVLLRFLRRGVTVEAIPQGRLEIAYRVPRWLFLGVRFDVTRTLQPSSVSTALEPFVRVDIPDAWTFLRLGLRIPLGPAYPFAATEPVGLLGVSLHGGVLF